MDTTFQKNIVSNTEIYVKDWNIRYDLNFPSDNSYSTIINKNGEFTYFKRNDREKWIVISMKEHVFGPINLFDPRKFCGLDSFKIDYFETLKNLVNPEVKEHISKDGSSIIEVSGTNIYKKIYFKYLFSSKNDFLVTSLLVDYGDRFILYESKYSDVIGLGIKFPKQLTKKYINSKKDLDDSKDNWEHFEKYEIVCFPNYKINDDLFKFITPEGYVVKDLIRNPNDNIYLKR